jgi:small subunit ribosomal protein S20
MAHHKSALKRIRQTKKRRIYNRLNKKSLKMAIREVREAQNFETAWEKFQKATRILDKVSSRGVIHKNNAANKKSSLAHFVNSLKAKTA